MTGREPARSSIDAGSTESTEEALAQIDEWMRDPSPWPQPEPPQLPDTGDDGSFDPLGAFKRGFVAGAGIGGAILLVFWLAIP